MAALPEDPREAYLQGLTEAADLTRKRANMLRTRAVNANGRALRKEFEDAAAVAAALEDGVRSMIIARRIELGLED